MCFLWTCAKAKRPPLLHTLFECLMLLTEAKNKMAHPARRFTR